jgi:hypothetical protein
MNSDKIHADQEGRLLHLLDKSQDYLTQDEFTEVQKRVHHKEYALALQSFLYGFIAEARPLSQEALVIADELITQMGMKNEDDDDYWLWEKFHSAMKTPAIAQINQREKRATPPQSES